MSAGTEKQGLGKGRQRSINLVYLVHLHENLSQVYRYEYLLSFHVCKSCVIEGGVGGGHVIKTINKKQVEVELS